MGAPIMRNLNLREIIKGGDNMDRKKGILAVAISVALAAFALTAVTATSWKGSTPLYAFRMEQVSSEMNFLPTTAALFAYTAENGHNLAYNIGPCDCGDENPLMPYTCATCSQEMCDEPTVCGTCGTCSWMQTCSPNTCPWTEWPFCEYTLRYPTCWWPGC